MKNVIVHIGYPKAASTWLQKEVFPLFKEKCELFIKNRITRELFEDYAGKFNVENYIKNFTTDKDCLILSDERFMGGVLTGGMNGFAWQAVATRIKKVFPEAKIIIVIRNQIDIIASAYSHYIRYGGTFSFKKFYYSPGYYVVQKAVLFNKNFFDYYNVYSFYASLFGKNNILVIPYEILLSSPLEFVSQIEDFSGIRINKSNLVSKVHNKGQSYKDMQIQRIINLFTRYNITLKKYLIDLKFRPENFQIRLFPSEKNKSEKIISKKIRKEIMSFYSNNNTRLFNELGIDKEKFGYP